LAFSSTVTGVKSLGSASMIYGTWSAASVTQGNIKFAMPITTVATGSNQTTTGDVTVTGTDISVGVIPSMLVEGTGIRSGTLVSATPDANTVVLDHSATASGTVTLTYTKLLSVSNPVSAKCISSTSATTMTAAQLIPRNSTIALTCVSGDAGWWSVVYG